MTALNGHTTRPHIADRLLPHHEEMLRASAIDPGIAQTRGYRSAIAKDELEALGFGPRQRLVPALVIPVWNTRGECALHQIRPDEPRLVRGKRLKYETPRGARMVLDVPPAARPSIGDPSQPLWITEGARKADAAVSAGVCCVAVIGVWNWRGTNDQGGKTALADWEDVALNDRQVLIAFDSDVTTKPEVRKALDRLEALVRRRGGRPKRLHLASTAAGDKVGLDDYLAAGGTLEQLLEAPAPPEPARTSGDGRGPSQATQLVALADEAGIDVFHTEAGEGWATVRVGEHLENWPISARGTGGLKRWLRGLVYARTQSGVSEQALQEAIGTLDSRAHYEGPQRPVFTRLGELEVDGEPRVYLDLGDADWRVVEITAGGWRTVSEPSIKFRRGRGVRELPAPERGGSIEELRPFVNVTQEDDWTRLVGWLLGCLSPRPPYPLLCLHGEQGSAKSTTAEMLRRVIDPSFPALRSAPEGERDLMIAATGTWCLAFDNLSGIRDWLSDALCRLAYGAGYATRELHSDGDEVLFEAARPVLLTGIVELATRSDLLSRTLLLELPPIRPDTVRTRREMEAAFATAHPRVLGALLDAAACALRRRDDITPAVLPRMADFAVWVTAAEPALGWPDGRFLAAYTANQETAHVLALESSPVGPALLQLAEHGFEGTLADALEQLRTIAGEAANRPGWPSQPNRLSSLIKRLAPNLRAAGVDVEMEPRGRGRNRRKILTLRQPTCTIGPIGPIGPTQLETTAQSQMCGADGSADHGERGRSNAVPGPVGADAGPITRSGTLPAVAPNGADGADGADRFSLQKEEEDSSAGGELDRAAATPEDEARAQRLLDRHDERSAIDGEEGS